MTAAVLATTCATAASGSGTAAPDVMAWANLFGQGAAETQFLTAAGITSGPASITATITGSAALYYTLNTTTKAYSGAFNLSNGDTLGWSVLTFSTSRQSGTVTVKAAAGSVTVGTFNYVLVGNND